MYYYLIGFIVMMIGIVTIIFGFMIYNGNTSLFSDRSKSELNRIGEIIMISGIVLLLIGAVVFLLSISLE